MQAFTSRPPVPYGLNRTRHRVTLRRGYGLHHVTAAGVVTRSGRRGYIPRTSAGSGGACSARPADAADAAAAAGLYTRCSAADSATVSTCLS